MALPPLSPPSRRVRTRSGGSGRGRRCRSLTAGRRQRLAAHCTGSGGCPAPAGSRFPLARAADCPGLPAEPLAPEEALLWELRRKLLSAGIDPGHREEAVCKVSRLLQCCQRSSLERSIHQVRQLRYARRQRVLRQSCGGVEVRSRPREGANLMLDQAKWAKLCGALDVPAPRGRQLFSLLAGENSEFVDFQGALTRLRTTCAPDVSLERFVTRLLDCFESLQEAFSAVCSQPGHLLRWPGFYALVEALDINDRNAHELWDALTAEGCSDVARRRAGLQALMEAEPGIAEATFLQRLGLWAPTSALSALRHRLLDRFGGLGAARRALEHQGLGRGVALAQQTLAAGLEVLGIRSCEVPRVLREVPSARGHLVTLDDLFAALCNSQRGASRDRHGARAAVREGTLGLWQTLHAVQDDLREGHWSRIAGARHVEADCQPQRCKGCRPRPPCLADPSEEAEEVGPCPDAGPAASAAAEWAAGGCTPASCGGRSRSTASIPATPLCPPACRAGREGLTSLGLLSRYAAVATAMRCRSRPHGRLRISLMAAAEACGGQADVCTETPARRLSRCQSVPSTSREPAASEACRLERPGPPR